MNFARGFVSDPEVLFLDEPTLGMDVNAARRLRGFVAEWMRERPGRTVLLTTHYMAEADELCDRIAIMDEGRIVACGTLAELLALSHATEVVELRLAVPLSSDAPLAALEGVDRVEVAGSELRLFTARAQHALPRIYRTLSTMGHGVVRTRVTPVTLADFFLQLTGKGLRD